MCKALFLMLEVLAVHIFYYYYFFFFSSFWGGGLLFFFIFLIQYNKYNIFIITIIILETKYGLRHTHTVWANRQITDLYLNGQIDN